jgi:glucose-6-phosphate 1-dehydrogenase
MREPNQYQGRLADPCAMVFCGASGDLTKRKLIPALYSLANDHLLSTEFAIIGFARNDLNTGAFRRQLAEDIKTFATGSVDAEILEWLPGRTYYVTGDFKDPKAYQKLKEVMAQEIRSHSAHEEDGRWRRVIIEKPFGRDLKSVRAMNAAAYRYGTRTPTWDTRGWARSSSRSQSSAGTYLSPSIIERRSSRRLIPRYRPIPSSNRFAFTLVVNSHL